MVPELAGVINSSPPCTCSLQSSSHENLKPKYQNFVVGTPCLMRPATFPTKSSPEPLKTLDSKEVVNCSLGLPKVQALVVWVQHRINGPLGVLPPQVTRYPNTTKFKSCWFSFMPHHFKSQQTQFPRLRSTSRMCHLFGTSNSTYNFDC